MTCDIMLRLSPGELVVVTDERTTYGGRQADYSQKMTIKDKYITTRTGRVDNSAEINRRWMDAPQKSTLKEELESFKQIFQDVYRIKLNDYANQYGITLAEVKEGKINRELLPTFGAKAEEFLRSPTGFSTAFLFGGWNDQRKEMEIYDVISPGMANPQERYAVMGSGEDRAQTVLSDYIASLARHERDCIPRTEGVHKVIEALYAASKNAGVGGTPDIVILQKEGYRRMLDKASRLLYNIIVKEARGEIKPRKALELFERIIFAGENRNVSTRKVIKKIANEIASPDDPLEYLLS